MTKVCRDCKESKALGKFTANAACVGGRRPACKSCENVKRNARYALHKDSIQAERRRQYHANLTESRRQRREGYYRDREWWILRQQLRIYGLTLDQYHALQERQDFSCAICGDELTNKKEGTHIDHCHNTHRVRGLLCGGCNKGLGQFRERPEALMAAADYVIR